MYEVLFPWRKQKALVIVPMTQVYRIAHNDCRKCYIGSTFETLVKRMARHSREYKQYLLNEQNKQSERPMVLFDAFDIDNCKIELVKEPPTPSRKQLLNCEGFYR